MLNMFPMQGMGSQGLGMAGGAGLDPRILAMLGSALGGMQGGGGMPAPSGGPINAALGGMSPMSQFIGARPPIGAGPMGSGMAPVVGGAMAAPPLPSGMPTAPGATANPLATAGTGIADMLKTTQGLQSLLNTLKGGQTGLTPQQNAAPTGGLPPVGPQGMTQQGASMDPMAFLRQLLGSGAAGLFGGGGMGAGIPSGQGYT